MPELRFEEHAYEVDDFDTVLNTLLKNGHAIPNFCRSGICHSCMMKAEVGTPLPFTQIGLCDELVAENYFLTCQCAVYAPMTICRPDKDKRTRFVAMVRDIVHVTDDLVKLMLSPEHEFEYRAGQYTTLHNVDGLSADFPIASVHGDGRLMEFHVQANRSPLHHYIVTELDVGDGLEIQTALGNHYYCDELENKHIVVAGVDTDIANGLSLLLKASEQQHRSGLTFVCIKHEASDDYFDSIKHALTDLGIELNFEILAVADADRIGGEIISKICQLEDENATIFIAAQPQITTDIISQYPEWRSLAVDGNCQ